MTPPRPIGSIIAGSPLLKALPTEYRGLQFRSRLEARWAVFFDTLGIPYEYEREGYDLDGVWYLPDFWLPSIDSWVEIKPKKITDEERDKLRMLSEVTQKCCFAFQGGFVLGMGQCQLPIPAHYFWPNGEGYPSDDDDGPRYWNEDEPNKFSPFEFNGNHNSYRLQQAYDQAATVKFV